jgi:hypothetical protein
MAGAADRDGPVGFFEDALAGCEPGEIRSGFGHGLEAIDDQVGSLIEWCQGREVGRAARDDRSFFPGWDRDLVA